MPPRRRAIRKRNRAVKKYGKTVGRTRSRATTSLVKAAMPHYHCRWESLAKETSRTVILDPTGNKYGALSFNVQDLEAINELAVLYDSFVVTKVIVNVKWTPVLSGTQANNTAGWAPLIKYYYDYDDDAVPTDSAMRQRAKVKLRQLTPERKTLKMAITPAVLLTGYQGLTSSIYIPKFKQKIDMGSKNVDMYGIKYAIEYPNGISNGTVEFKCKYYLSCMTTR